MYSVAILSDAINALKGFPFEQFFCLLMFMVVVLMITVLNKTLRKLEKAIFGQTFVLNKALEALDQCRKNGKVL